LGLDFKHSGRFALSTALVASAVLLASCGRSLPEILALWPDGAPGAVGSRDVDTPTLELHHAPADRATGAAIVVVPGGGYTYLDEYQLEAIVRWLTDDLGVSAFLLRYRVAPEYGHPAPFLDAQRAVRTVRVNAVAWGIDAERVGMLGFSAGGHLVSTVGTHHDDGDPTSPDPVERVASRPNFMILVYPVISMVAEFTHEDSRLALLGATPDPGLARYLSSELHVTPETPPTLLLHNDGDPLVPAENSVAFYLALQEAGVSAELHVFQNGRHGPPLSPKGPWAAWPELAQTWLEELGVISPN
jgi:acetyl esterase/lipase